MSADACITWWETANRSMATARTRLPEVAAAHCLGLTPGTDVADAVQGHAEAPGQGARKTEKTG